MQEVEELYADLRKGMPINQLLERYAAIHPLIQSRDLVQEYRLRKSPFKHLAEEVTPAVHFVRPHPWHNDIIRFSLSSEFPDCFINHVTPKWERDIEITSIQAREQLYIMRKLNQDGEAPGFMGLTNDQSKEDFEKKISEERIAYSTDQVRETIIKALQLCSKKKGHHQAHTLIIGAPMEILPDSAWKKMQPDLTAPIAKLSFSEIYLVGSQGEKDCCISLKPQA